MTQWWDEDFLVSKRQLDLKEDSGSGTRKPRLESLLCHWLRGLGQLNLSELQFPHLWCSDKSSGYAHLAPGWLWGSMKLNAGERFVDWPDPCRHAPCDGGALPSSVWQKGPGILGHRQSAEEAHLPGARRLCPSLGTGPSNVPTSLWTRLSHTLEEGSLPTFPFLAESSALHVCEHMRNQKCQGLPPGCSPSTRSWSWKEPSISRWGSLSTFPMDVDLDFVVGNSLLLDVNSALFLCYLKTLPSLSWNLPPSDFFPTLCSHHLSLVQESEELQWRKAFAEAGHGWPQSMAVATPGLQEQKVLVALSL